MRKLDTLRFERTKRRIDRRGRERNLIEREGRLEYIES